MSSSRYSNVVVHPPGSASSSASTSHQPQVHYAPYGYLTTGNSTSMSSRDTSTYGLASSSGRGSDPNATYGEYRHRDADGHQARFAHRNDVTVWQGNGLRNGSQNDPTPGYSTRKDHHHGSHRSSRGGNKKS